MKYSLKSFQGLINIVHWVLCAHSQAVFSSFKKDYFFPILLFLNVKNQMSAV